MALPVDFTAPLAEVLMALPAEVFMARLRAAATAAVGIIDVQLLAAKRALLNNAPPLWMRVALVAFARSGRDANTVAQAITIRDGNRA